MSIRILHLVAVPEGQFAKDPLKNGKDQAKWAAAEVVGAYRGQQVIEQAFKEMKCAESVRATLVFHWTDQKIKAHLFICLLALLLKVAVRELLAQKYLRIASNKIKQILGQVRLVSGTPNDAMEFAQLSNMVGSSKELADALGLLVLLEEPDSAV